MWACKIRNRLKTNLINGFSEGEDQTSYQQSKFIGLSWDDFRASYHLTVSHPDWAVNGTGKKGSCGNLIGEGWNNEKRMGWTSFGDLKKTLLYQHWRQFRPQFSRGAINGPVWARGRVFVTDTTPSVSWGLGCLHAAVVSNITSPILFPVAEEWWQGGADAVGGNKGLEIGWVGLYPGWWLICILVEPPPNKLSAHLRLFSQPPIFSPSRFSAILQFIF